MKWRSAVGSSHRPCRTIYQYLHSTNARDEKGNLKPQTNNIFVWGRPDTDVLSEKVRTGATVEEVRDAAWKLQRIMHDEAIFVPGYSVDFVRVGSWRWVRWPDCENTRFCPPVVYDPHEVFVFWIDEEMQAETQAATPHRKVLPGIHQNRGCLPHDLRSRCQARTRRTRGRPRIPMNDSSENILEVDKLITSFETDRGLLRAVDQVSFTVPEGKTVGIVGESGCGKSVTAMSIVRLLAPAGRQDPRRPRVFQRTRSAPRQRLRNAQNPRRRHRRDFPGTDVRPQSGPPHRQTGLGSHPLAQEESRKRMPGTRPPRC